MFILTELTFPLDALEPHIDTKTMEIHHGKHHATYVKNLNDLVTDKTEKDLEELLKTTENQKIKNNGGGHLNHSLFWQMMSPTPTQPSAEFITKLGNLEDFKAKFKEEALARFGSGWVWLTNDFKIVSTPNQDNPIMEGQNVLLGLDVWEHAYYLKYQNKRADYIDAWWNVVNWKFVSDRYESFLGK